MKQINEIQQKFIELQTYFIGKTGEVVEGTFMGLTTNITHLTLNPKHGTMMFKMSGEWISAESVNLT